MNRILNVKKLKKYIWLLLISYLNVGISENLTWGDHDLSSYIDNRVDCKKTIDSIKRSFLLNPQGNQSSATTRISYVNDDQLRKKVITNLKMEMSLNDLFNIDITSRMLQADINRMIRNSKNKKRLFEIFEALDNDPITIAECLSRPYLVRDKLQRNYIWNNRFHGELKKSVESELNLYLANTEDHVLSAITNFQRFELSTNENISNGKTNSIILSKEEFENKISQIESNEVKETEYLFLYEELISKSINQIEIKQLAWKKESFEHWINNYVESRYDVSFYQKGNAKNLELHLLESTDIVSSKGATKKQFEDYWEIPDIPEPRNYHTAVWTGSEMIIWGGISMNTGGRYDPITDTWIRTSIENAPYCNYIDCISVWTGTEMVVWSRPRGTNLEDGGKYNPITDSWQEISISNASELFSFSSSVWTGEEIILWGTEGGSGSDPSTTKGIKYNPTTDSWSDVSNIGAPSLRMFHSAVWTGEEMIIWGGSEGQFEPDLNTGGKYNPVTDTWTEISSINAPTPRADHEAVWTGSEMIIWGGEYNTQPEVNPGGKYNPENDLWTPISLNPFKNYSNRRSSVWTGSKMIVWHTVGSIYDPETDSWTEVSNENAPSHRGGFSNVWTGDEMIIWGGSRGLAVNTGGRYHPESNTWLATPTSGGLNSPRIEYTTVWTGAEMILWGGNPGSLGSNVGEAFDPVTSTWRYTSLENAPDARYEHSAVWTGSKMIIWGGRSIIEDQLGNTGGIYDPITDNWEPMMDSPISEGRRNHKAILAENQMLVWSGFASPSDEKNSMGLIYDIDSDSWSTIPSYAPFEDRELINQTIIWSGRDMVVWGGNRSLPIEIGGRFNPAANRWLPISTKNAPVGRANHLAIWARDKMVIWGGRSSELKSGGMYDPFSNEWQATSLINTPEDRRNAFTVWTGREVIVWGGSFDENTGGRLDPETNQWLPVSTTYAPDYGTDPVWTGEAMIMYGEKNSTGVSTYFPRKTLSIGGTVSGLLPNTELVIRNQTYSTDTIRENGSFTIERPLFSGEDYSVSILRQPVFPNQTCSIRDNSGTVTNNDITSISIDCSVNLYSINVSVLGLADGNRLSLSESSNNNLIIFEDGDFSFPNSLEDGSNYDISIELVGNNIQNCGLINGTGMLLGKDVNNMQVLCDDSVPDLIFMNGFEN